MAINKKLIHFKNFSDFNSKKLSANENNTQYTLGINGAVTNGSPDILYQSICYIKDTKQQWTHGQLYDGSKSDTPLNETDPVFSASPAASITEEKKAEWDNKADNSSVVHLSGNETITGAKTFNGRVNFLGSGDSNAMYLSTNTRLNVDGTTNTVLGFSSGTFLINNAAYNLTLRGKGTRPTYNSTTLALSSDIPAAVTESTVSGWGFTKNTGTYSKPSTGIPVSDLSEDIQTSLGKANTALQSYTEQYKGTITGVSANGTSVATSGVANIPAASTSVYGVTKLNSATNSTSTTEAATPSAVKAAYDLANSYKGTVTSVKINGTTKNPSSGVVDLGTVITSHQTLKTINGQSIIGSGDVVIGGGNVQAVDTGDVLDDVTVDYATKTYVDGLIGDINSILESIINGDTNEIMTIINGVSAIDIANTLINTYGAIGSLENPNPINENIIFSGFTSGVTENQKCEYIYINSSLNVIYLYGADYSSTLHCVRISLLDNDPYYGLPQIYMYD